MGELMNKKKIFTWIVILLVIGLVGYRIYNSFFVKKEEVIQKNIVSVEETKEIDIIKSSPVSAKIVPKEEIGVIPMAQGQITSINVKMGDRVSSGSVLLTIDSTQQGTMVNKAKEGYVSASNVFDRMNRLYQEGAVSKQEFENAQTQLAIANETYTSAKDAYNNCIVTSPIDGYVTSVNRTVGDMSGGAMPAVTIADVSSLTIDVNVAESVVAKIKEGDIVSFKVGTLGDKTYQGKVEAISPAPVSKGVTYPVKIKVLDETGEVKAGMFAEINIKSVEKSKALVVPTSAVVIKKGETKVAVLGKNNKVKFKVVKTGIDADKYMEIKEGLTLGEKVIVQGQEYVVDDEEVLVK